MSPQTCIGCNKVISNYRPTQSTFYTLTSPLSCWTLGPKFFVLLGPKCPMDTLDPTYGKS